MIQPTIKPIIGIQLNTIAITDKGRNVKMDCSA